MIHDKLENWKLYFSAVSWRTAFEYFFNFSIKIPLAHWLDRGTLEDKTAYDAELGLTFCHQAVAACSRANSSPGYFTLLSLNDTYMPMLQVDNVEGDVKGNFVRLPVTLLLLGQD